VERAFHLFSEYLSEGCQGRVREVECAAIDWDSGWASIIKRKVRKPKLQQMTKPVRSRRRCDEESCNLRQG